MGLTLYSQHALVDLSVNIDFFQTIQSESEGIYKEKGSKFLAFAYPVKNEEDVKAKLELLRKQYYDARHHCYAYIFGNQGEHFRANDDGEPNHSAGDPILGQIRSKEITNTLVVVVRYFGGTKLGVSGLINAYKTAAAQTLDANRIIQCPITKPYRFTFPYESTNTIMKLIADFDLQITNQSFEANCMIDFAVVISQINPLLDQVQLVQDLGNDVKLTQL